MKEMKYKIICPFLFTPRAISYIAFFLIFIKCVGNHLFFKNPKVEARSSMSMCYRLK